MRKLKFGLHVRQRVGWIIVITYLGTSCVASGIDITPSNTAPIDFPSQTFELNTATTAAETPRLLQTATPSPPSWVTPFPKEAIFVQYGSFGGDGGNSFDFYYGRSTPNLIVYTHGMAIQRIGTYSSYRFQAALLSEAEMCDLQRGILGPKLPEYDDLELVTLNHPLYNFDDSTSFADGAGVYIYQLNGNPSLYLSISLNHLRYVVPELNQIIEFVESYTLTDPTTYEPKSLLLWIEKGRGSADENTSVGEWPESLPSLESLFVSRIEGQGFFNSSHVVLEGSLAQQVGSLFDDEMKGMLFREDGKLFYTILRPLLPHESPERFSVFPSRTEPYEIPFSCLD